MHSMVPLIPTRIERDTPSWIFAVKYRHILARDESVSGTTGPLLAGLAEREQHGLRYA